MESQDTSKSTLNNVQEKKMSSQDRQNIKLPDLLVNGKTLSNETDRDPDVVARDAPGNAFEAWSSSPWSPIDSNCIEQFQETNRQLVCLIEVLKYKIEVDKKERAIAKEKFVDSCNKELRNKDLYIERLKSTKQKEEKELENLTEENQRKNRELIRYDLYVADLQRDVESSKLYAEGLDRQLDELRKTPLQTAQEQSDLDKKIAEMRKEIEIMKENLATLENQLAKANEKIEEQGNKLRLMEVERGNAEIMFKESMEKATRAMRSEIEKVRDVMGRQYREMREYNNKTEAIRQYMQEIVHLLTPAQAPVATQVSVQHNNRLTYESTSLAEQKKLQQRQPQARKRT